MLLLGGRDTGKSLELCNFEKQKLIKVFIVDLRIHGGDIIKVLTTVLSERKARLEGFVQQVARQGAKEVV